MVQELCDHIRTIITRTIDEGNLILSCYKFPSFLAMQDASMASCIADSILCPFQVNTHPH